jgi:aryl-alcohol dehydrogenase-like predicted oxidoreductase
MISEIGFGCGPTAGLMLEGEAENRRRIVRRALDLGVNYFDTAAAYGDGRSETSLGVTLQALDARPLVGTKVTLEWDDLGDIAGAVARSIHGSLTRLGLETLDIVHLHNRPGRSRALRPALGSGAQLSVEDVLGPAGVVEALFRLRDRGLVGAIGCCGFGGEADAVLELIESDRFDSVLVNYSLLNRSAWSGPAAGPAADPDYAGAGVSAARRGMGVVALRVLEAGLLTGRPAPKGAETSDPPAPAARLGRLAFLLEEDAASWVTPGLRFVLSNPAISTALVGVSTLDHIEAAAEAAALGPFSSAILQRIDDAWPADDGGSVSEPLRDVPRAGESGASRSRPENPVHSRRPG